MPASLPGFARKKYAKYHRVYHNQLIFTGTCPAPSVSQWHHYLLFFSQDTLLQLEFRASVGFKWKEIVIPENSTCLIVIHAHEDTSERVWFQFWVDCLKDCMHVPVMFYLLSVNGGFFHIHFWAVFCVNKVEFSFVDMYVMNLLTNMHALYICHSVADWIFICLTDLQAVWLLVTLCKLSSSCSLGGFQLFPW